MVNKCYFTYNRENNMCVVYLSNEDISIPVMWVDATYALYQYGGGTNELENAMFLIMERLSMTIEH